jgi:hypothetical protein
MSMHREENTAIHCRQHCLEVLGHEEIMQLLLEMGVLKGI